jgi:hypothetical protein
LWAALAVSPAFLLAEQSGNAKLQFDDPKGRHILGWLATRMTMVVDRRRQIVRSSAGLLRRFIAARSQFS